MPTSRYWLLAAFVIGGCGGSQSTGAGPDGGGGDTSAPASDGASDVTVHDGSSSDVANRDVMMSPDVITNPDGPGGPDGVTPFDGGPDGGPPDGAPADGGGITCGAPPPCTVGAQVCCYDRTTGSLTCTAPVGCNTGNTVPIPCSTAVNCAALGNPTDVCCATVGNVGLISVSCGPPASCAPGGLIRTELCDPNAPMPCPHGGMCVTAPVLPAGYYGCM